MASTDKLEFDYKAFVKKVEEKAAADIEKIRADLYALKSRAEKYIAAV
jgi:hypothetical protein